VTYEYAQITVFDIFLSNSLVLGYSASLSSLVRIAREMTRCTRATRMEISQQRGKRIELEMPL
jgi:hypothetical protein